jgi:endonuclease/exonuclease/phosphatase family metal-dependent hydrolase
MEAAFYPENEALEGLAVLSRVPIVSAQGLKLPSEGDQAAAMRIALDPERLVADPVASQLGYLYVYNVWLGFRVIERNGQPIPEGEQDQNRQLRALLSWIAAWHGATWTDRIVLGGTFNYDPGSPLYTELSHRGLIDPISSMISKEAMTVFLVDGAEARYDYLWTFNIPLEKGRADIHKDADTDNASDHRPVVIQFPRHKGVTCPQDQPAQ